MLPLTTFARAKGGSDTGTDHRFLIHDLDISGQVRFLIYMIQLKLRGWELYSLHDLQQHMAHGSDLCCTDPAHQLLRNDRIRRI